MQPIPSCARSPYQTPKILPAHIRRVVVLFTCKMALSLSTLSKQCTPPAHAYWGGGASIKVGCNKFCALSCCEHFLWGMLLCCYCTAANTVIACCQHFLVAVEQRPAPSMRVASISQWACCCVVIAQQLAPSLPVVSISHRATCCVVFAHEPASSR